MVLIIGRGSMGFARKMGGLILFGESVVPKRSHARGRMLLNRA